MVLLVKRTYGDIQRTFAVPEVINWEQVKCFKYSGSREEYHDIDINVFLASCENLEDLSMSKLKNKSIKAISAENENQVLYNWSAQKCLIAEIEYEDTPTFSIWIIFSINFNFINNVNPI